VSFQHPDSFSCEEYDADVDNFFLLALGSMWSHFYILPNKFLHFTLSSLFCTSTLHPKVLCMFPFVSVTSLFSLLRLKVVLPSSRSVYCYLTTDVLLIVVGSSVAMCALSFIKPCLCFAAAHPVSPLLKSSAVTLGLYFSTLYHCVSHTYLILHRITAYSCYLCITVCIIQRQKKAK